VLSRVEAQESMRQQQTCWGSVSTRTCPRSTSRRETARRGASTCSSTPRSSDDVGLQEGADERTAAVGQPRGRGSRGGATRSTTPKTARRWPSAARPTRSRSPAQDPRRGLPDVLA
jgi:hypothetical protein